jgi:hypothetical protein
MRNRHRLPPSSWGDGLHKVGGPERKEPGIPRGDPCATRHNECQCQKHRNNAEGYCCAFRNQAAKPVRWCQRQGTIEPRCKAHKPADSGVVVGKGARMRGLQGLNNPSDAPYNCGEGIYPRWGAKRP